MSGKKMSKIVLTDEQILVYSPKTGAALYIQRMPDGRVKVVAQDVEVVLDFSRHTNDSVVETDAEVA